MKVQTNDIINVHRLFGRGAELISRNQSTATEPVILDNRLLNVHSIDYALSERPNSIDVMDGSPAIYNPPFTEVVPLNFPPSWFMYERKRWTGPEIKFVRTRNHAELPGDGVIHDPQPKSDLDN